MSRAWSEIGEREWDRIWKDESLHGSEKTWNLGRGRDDTSGLREPLIQDRAIAGTGPQSLVKRKETSGKM